ncbi:MAG: type II toxin-antitoxin system RelE/ParE family toxin [Candidatus Aenigmatarchaeota archaeon]
MSSYNLTYTERFKERLEELDNSIKERILEKLEEFGKQINDYGIDPRQHNNTKFIADGRTWRLRIGKYRAFFDISKNEIKFTTVLHRKKAYR